MVDSIDIARCHFYRMASDYPDNLPSGSVQRLISNLTDRLDLGEGASIYDRMEEAKEEAADYFPEIGSGQEASVYRINPDWVLKISTPVNIRGEYIIFADPKYERVTPDVHHAHPDWIWMVVENVDLLGGPGKIGRHFPSLKREADEEGKRVSEMMSDLLVARYNGYRPFSYSGLSDEAKEWFDLIADMIQDLGLGEDAALDIYWENLGFDQSGNLVVTDIYTHSAIL